MIHKSQTARRKSRMAFVTEFRHPTEDASEPVGLESDMLDAQSIEHHKPTVYPEMLRGALENTDEYSLHKFQKQASVKFDLIPIPQSFNLPVAFKVLINKVSASPRSIVAAVELLVSIVGENKHQSITSLTADDFQKLASAQNKLINAVSEDENHLLGPLLIFIDNLIKNHDGESNSSMREHFRPTRRPEHVGRPANRPRIKLSDLLPQKIENIEDNEDVNTSSYKPHRPEHVGRPANRPRVKLTDLLLKEAEHIAAREVDTEMPVDNEE